MYALGPTQMFDVAMTYILMRGKIFGRLDACWAALLVLAKFSLVTISYAVCWSWAFIHHSLRVMDPPHLDICDDVPRDSALGWLQLL